MVFHDRYQTYDMKQNDMYSFLISLKVPVTVHKQLAVYSTVALRQKGDRGSISDESMLEMFRTDITGSKVACLSKIDKTEYTLLTSPYPTDCSRNEISHANCVENCFQGLFINERSPFANVTYADMYKDRRDDNFKQCRKSCSKPRCHQINFIGNVIRQRDSPKRTSTPDDYFIFLYLNKMKTSSKTLPKLSIEDLLIGLLNINGLWLGFSISDMLTVIVTFVIKLVNISKKINGNRTEAKD